MDKVSIIIPCYNDGCYLDESISSALAQTYPDLEVILVDDGSEETDTQEKVHSWEGHPKVRVVYGEHGGTAAARNLGISHAKGKYILPLDADDWIEPDYVEKAVPVLVSSVETAIVYSRADLFENEQREWDLGEFSMGKMLQKNMIFSAAVFRKEDWERVGGYCEELKQLEDWDLWLSLLELRPQVIQLDEILFHYRQRKGSISLSNQSEPPEVVLERYHKILMRHLALYQKNLVAYCDHVTELNLWLRYQKRQCEQALLEEKNRRTAEARQHEKALAESMADSYCRLHIADRKRMVTVVVIADGSLQASLRTMKSVQGQVYPHWEVFFAGCPDAEADALRKALCDMGVARAEILPSGNSFRELGERAKGDYVQWLRAGDTIHAQRFQQMVSVLETHEAIGAAISGAQKHDTLAAGLDFSPDFLRVSETGGADFFAGQEMIGFLLKTGGYVCGGICSALFRRGLMDQLEWMESYFRQEMPMRLTAWVEILKRINMFAIIHAILMEVHHVWTADAYILYSMELYYTLQQSVITISAEELAEARLNFMKRKDHQREQLRKEADPSLYQAYAEACFDE